MYDLKNIKNYIYSKGVLSSICPKTNALKGTHKGKAFKIYIKTIRNQRNSKATAQMVLELGGKKFYPKNNHVLGAMLK